MRDVDPHCWHPISVGDMRWHQGTRASPPRPWSPTCAALEREGLCHWTRLLLNQRVREMYRGHVMTTAVEVWTTLVKDGVTRHGHAGQRRMYAPTGVLPDTLRQAIQEHTAGLMTRLTPDPLHGAQRACAVSPAGQPQWSGLSSGRVQGLRGWVPMGHVPQEVSA